MKSLRDIVIALIPITLITYMIIWDFGNIKYLQYLFQEAISNPSNWIDIWKFVLLQLLTLFNIVAPVVYFSSQNPAIKRKAYSLIRFVFVISFVFTLPAIYAQFRYLDNSPDGNSLLLVLRYLIMIFTAVVLWISKPADQVPFISLENYEMVSYTTRGHRFLHYFVDLLFITTISYNWYQYPRRYYSAGYDAVIINSLVSWANILVYYFLSEIMFRQTLGKMLTNSCVVASHGNMGGLRVVGRAFARLIPFDALSFLWNGDWHDKASGTAVVYTYSWEDIVFEGEEIDQA
ncbi:MAG: hypothetical protein J7578_17520 [Chitinophagaceae bacterium]|nr:hypothetical protein [Chitinophagaceae bacterium]